KFLISEAFDSLEKAPEKSAEKYTEMIKYLGGLGDDLDKLSVKLTPQTRSKLDYQLAVMKKYANMGLAEVEFRKGKYDDVIKATLPTVEAVKKLDSGKELKLKDYEVTGDVLGLALRANVQKGNLTQGKALLGMLKRLRPEG